MITEKFIEEKIKYLHYNPVEAGFVEKPEDYLLSSAKNYYLNENGLIQIEYL